MYPLPLPALTSPTLSLPSVFWSCWHCPLTSEGQRLALGALGQCPLLGGWVHGRPQFHQHQAASSVKTQSPGNTLGGSREHPCWVFSPVSFGFRQAITPTRFPSSPQATSIRIPTRIPAGRRETGTEISFKTNKKNPPKSQARLCPPPRPAPRHRSTPCRHRPDLLTKSGPGPPALRAGAGAQGGQGESWAPDFELIAATSSHGSQVKNSH